ncbi:acyl-CoA dehydrogenase [Marinobacterium arenosum]|uniref:acyl-CoA dehydrogenase n=1 Tax=Marinobacterium arenosum TaxID=2862496 RepID=UPI001C9832EA|nr:acyl-CoA dehydrogenase [Marinobacterium arenosum]MBY4677483.1 acyl-CoA dehydrogenase [Marinobacterium arenosum]
MSDYRFPRQDALFVLQQLVGLEALCRQAGLDEVNDELVSAILDEAARFGAEQLAPSNVQGDRQPARLGEQGVEETAGFAELYRQFRDAGWPALAGDPRYGGQGLPNVLSTAVNEIWQSANLAWSLCPLLTQGAIEALQYHGSDTLKQTYLPMLVSGEWVATMNLTEPDAGSDLAAIKTRAVPEGDHYRLSGQKIFITWGDHRMTDNIVHLVLARLPDAPAGVKGISLFLVPKFLPDEQGGFTELNDLQASALEHKLGIHGSPTCVMNYGDGGGALGYLVGEPNAGLACMFTMMNSARQAVGLQGLSVAERAYQQARDYARERLQGTLPDGRRLTIIHHPDVRRMLMQMKASLEAMRALAYVAAAEVDRARHVGEASDQNRHQARVELYTPIIKGWLTELAQEVAYLAIQVYGGMGYIEETGVAQYYRDARILTIYEGTTGIQALDLVGRKILADRGAALVALLDEIDADLQVADKSLEPLRQRVSRALQQARQAGQWLLSAAAENPQAAGAASVPLLMLLGYLCGGWQMLNAAQRAGELLQAGEGDADFLRAKQVTARFYCEQLLPRCDSLLAAIVAGPEAVMALKEEQF